MACTGGKPVTAMKFTVMTRSKWLGVDETSVFCNVMETGDILEVERPNGNHWGVGIRIEGAKSKGPESIVVVSLQPPSGKDKSRKVVKEPLHQFWTSGTRIRINNNSDRDHPYHDEIQIRKQIEHALKHTDRKWHNPEHFVYWCRHGEKVPERRRQESDVAKWGSLSASAGVWMFMKNRRRRNTE
ncbi:phospholipase A and acyltransferase 1 [Anabrus simplex]|uniref:phospholipase A and acyltransferase 1 n=1 Tax=Anabrus simplex TaxID=316456 RepID=UPI0034DCF133